MIKGTVDISHITYDMLEELVFTERTETRNAGGFWDTIGTTTPNFPEGSDIVFQTFGDTCPSWVNDVSLLFNDWLKYSMVTVNKLTPGCFIPPHRDTLYRMKQKMQTEKLNVTDLQPVRVNLFLQDREIGHIFEMDGECLSSYKQGDFLIITPDKVHSVNNIGYLNRYTMQLTGFANLEDII